MCQEPQEIPPSLKDETVDQLFDTVRELTVDLQEALEALHRKVLS